MSLTRREFGFVALAAGTFAARPALAADKIYIGILPLASHSPTLLLPRPR